MGRLPCSLAYSGAHPARFGEEGDRKICLSHSSSFPASLGLSLPLENELKAQGLHSGDLPHHSSA